MDPDPRFLFNLLPILSAMPVTPGKLMPLIIAFVAFVLLLTASALISGSEIAFFSFSPTEVDRFRRSKKRYENRIASMLEKPRELLAVLLILNNTVNVAIVMLVTFVTWSVLGIDSSSGTAAAVLSAGVTFFIVFFGEVTPKVISGQRPQAFVRLTVDALLAVRALLSPFVFLLLNFTSVIDSRIKKKGFQANVDTLKHALELTSEQHHDQSDLGIFERIVNFNSIPVKDIMCSRTEIVAISITSDYHEVLDKINKNGYSRVPVYSETFDEVEGILYIKDLLSYIDEDETFEWQQLLRPPYFVPENKRISDLLRDFQRKRIQMAIVVDEYGGTSGLATMEDIIEEIFGDLYDEMDEDAATHTQISSNAWIFEAKVPIIDFQRITQAPSDYFDEVKGDSGSLSGLLIELNQNLPKAGQIIEYGQYKFQIIAADRRKLKRIKVTKSDAEATKTDNTPDDEKGHSDI